MNKIKFLLCLAMLVSGVEGRGQIYINSYRFGVAEPTELLLDSFGTGVQAAYSLRKLDKDYTGNCITIRRTSNGDTLQVGFAENEVDTAAIKTHCSGTTCTVVRWFDQSGNARNAAQATTGKQPIIYESGAIVRTGGSANKVSIRWDGTDDELNASISTLTSAGALCIFYAYSTNAAAAANTNTAYLYYNGTLNTTTSRAHGASTGILTGELMFLDVRTSSAGTQRLGSSTYTRSANTLVIENSFYLTTGTSFQQNNNNVILDLTNSADTTTDYTPSAANTSADFCIGAVPGAVFSNQKIAEMVIFNTSKTDDRSNINRNMNNFYLAY